MATTGRPKVFTKAAADKICLQISTSTKSLRKICEDKNLPCVATVLNWLKTNESFLAQYTRAKEEQADYIADEMMEIADDGTNDFMTITKGDKTYNVENKEVTNRSRLRVDTRKWIAMKLKPKKYGDKITQEHTGEGGGPVQTIIFQPAPSCEPIKE